MKKLRMRVTNDWNIICLNGLDTDDVVMINRIITNCSLYYSCEDIQIDHFIDNGKKYVLMNIVYVKSYESISWASECDIIKRMLTKYGFEVIEI